ncbi:hypothetical protein [Methanohalobium sp.]|uniref:hypothetical protein n=1 Tax=Methanohalobium sp. TaxID=2837493 RepID=UPI003182FC21
MSQKLQHVPPKTDPARSHLEYKLKFLMVLPSSFNLSRQPFQMISDSNANNAFKADTSAATTTIEPLPLIICETSERISLKGLIFHMISPGIYHNPQKTAHIRAHIYPLFILFLCSCFFRASTSPILLPPLF